jgi:hypothetical protein
MTELEAVHPHSLPGPVTSTPDGGILYVAEAGVLAVIEADQASSHKKPIKPPEPISSLGVRAVELRLDPDAELELLYVAGGRNGLWIMEADPDPMSGPLLATRIDAGDTGSGGRTWCNDIDFLEHEGTTYLVALFAHKLCSRVRLYPLNSVRALLDPTTSPSYQETGNELTALVDVGVGGNCSFVTPRSVSFGYGLTVDGTNVYVALGSYGVQRVRFPGTTITTFQVTDGPWFGDGSYYAQNVLALYENCTFHERSDPPQVVDVAVQREGSSAWLWLAADSLGILRFDLSYGWSQSMPIDHQEGEWVTVDGGDFDDRHEIRLLFANPTGQDHGGEQEDVFIQTYAHRLSIADTSRGPVLAVAVARRPLIFSDSILDEGRTLGHLGTGHQGTGYILGFTEDDGSPTELLPPNTTGPYEYTILYDLTALVPVTPDDTLHPPLAEYQFAKFVREGGRHLYLPPEQPEETQQVPGQLIAFGSTRLNAANRHSSFRALWDWPGDTTVSTGATNALPDEVLARSKDFRPGRNGYEVTQSPTNPRLLNTSSNDASFPPDGFLAYCNGEFVRYYDPPMTNPPGGADVRGTFGIIFNPFSTWPVDWNDHGLGDFVFGAGKASATDPTRWMLVHVDPGQALCNPLYTDHRLPERVKTIFISDQQDRFGKLGRGFYNGSSSVLLPFDLHYRTDDGAALIFHSRCATPAGGLVMNRETLEYISATATDGHIVPNDEIDVFLRELLTHPEFANAYNLTTPPVAFLTTHNLQGRIVTFAPQLAQLPAPEESSYDDHWVVAYPSGAIHFPPSVATIVDPEHAPDSIYLTYYDHAMVRVFDVNDYDSLEDPDAPIAAYTLIGPRPQTSAFRLEHLDWKGERYIFVGDFGGSVLVWRVTGLLDMPSGTIIEPDPYGTAAAAFVEEWSAPESVSDDINNNVWHIAIAHETWDDGTDDRDEIYVYALTGRYGLAVLRFDPGAAPGQRLTKVHDVRTPSGMGGLWMERDENGPQRLFINESTTGMRALVHPQ